MIWIVPLAAASAATAVWYFRRRWAAPKPRVLVVLKSGQTVRGVLVRQRDRQLQVADVTVIPEGAKEPIPAGGVIYLDRSNVAWVQRPEAD